MNKILETRRIYMQRIRNGDLKILCQWRNSQDFRKYCSVRRDKVSSALFKKELQKDFRRDRHLQMLIFLKRTNKPIGTIYSYGFKKIDGYVYITTFLSRSYRKKGYGAEAIALFLYHLFSNYPLYKIYMEIYGYNKSSLSTIANAGFSEEGRFREHRLYNGKRYDLFRYAVYKRDLSKITKFLKRLTKKLKSKNEEVKNHVRFKVYEK
jgi:RimJ/RimL family protein N-acetyltransferase